HLERTADEVADRLKSPGLVWVAGPTGAGRSSLAEQAARHMERAVIVRPPGFHDPDAPLHALLQSAGPLGHDTIAATVDDMRTLRERAREVGERLASGGYALFVVLPESWSDMF